MGENKTLLPFEDSDSEGNSEKWRTGETCVTEGCTCPAGTWWSPLWCMKCNIQRMYRIHAGLDEAITLAVLAKAVDEATSGLRSMAEKLTRQRDEAALIAWIPITPNIRIKDRDVLLTCGAGWYVRIGRWRDSHRQKLSAFMTTAGWWSREAAGYAYIPNQPNFYAEIPAAPSGPTGE